MRTRGRPLHPILPWALLLLWGTALLGSPEEPVPAQARGTIYLPGGQALQVEIADTPEKQARGYMFREVVPEGEGMVFLMPDLDIHPFWMKNCRVPLDIIWMDEDWRVVYIAASVPPCERDVCPSIVPMQKSHYVLEVAGGTSEALGLARGVTVRYAPPPSPSR